jgi:glycerol kinase
MNRTLVAAIDQGTTGTRLMLYDEGGRIVASDYREHRQICPRPGWVEHDPIEIWQNVQATVRNAFEKSRASPGEIAAVGVTNQRETTIVWDPVTGKPYYNAIVWQCNRTDALCQQIKKRGLELLIRERTGLHLSTYFSGPKIQWILDSVQGVRERALEGRAVFGNMDSWIIWNLTGGPEKGSHVTDYTNASRTMLMDLRKLDWDEEITSELDIPPQMLPVIRPSSDEETYGKTRIDGMLLGKCPRVRRPGRPAGSPSRTGMLQEGRCEEHLRDRLLHSDKYGPGTSILQEWTDHNLRLWIRAWKMRLCSGGLRSHCRSRHPVAKG